MGSLFSKLDDKMPEIYSYTDYQRITNQINQISIQIAKHTNFILAVNVLSLHFDYSNWKNSQIKATLGLFPKKAFKDRLFQTEQEIQTPPEYSFEQIFNLILSMRQLYNLFDVLKFFKKHKNGQRSTLTKTPLFQEGKGCQICFDQVADLALPCGHIFGANCVSKYIIDKEERSCPMCRRQFIGRRSAIQKDLYFVIDQDESIYDEVRTCLFDILKKRNEMTIKNALIALDLKNKREV